MSQATSSVQRWSFQFDRDGFLNSSFKLCIWLQAALIKLSAARNATFLHFRETKQPLHEQTAQHRRASSSGQDSDVHIHLKEEVLNDSVWTLPHKV